VLAGVFGECFEEVWNKYAWKTGWDLVEKTHESDSAWNEAIKRDGGKLGGFLDDEKIKRDGERWF
jgi:uncharacterized phage-associated protein